MATVSKLQIVLEATTEAFDRGLKNAQTQLKGFAKSTQDIHDKMDNFQRRHKKAFDTMRTVGAISAAGLVAVGAGIKATTSAAMDFESAMAGVKKVVDFETPAQFKEMEQDIIALSQRLPMVATDIAAIMEAAGQSGIARAELAAFAEDAVKMGVAFDITADQAGKAMAEMRAAFGMSQQEVVELADQLNYLGNNSTNAAADIMTVVQKIGSLAETTNVSSSTLAALSASLVGVAPEVASTGLKNFMLQLAKGEQLSKSAKNAFVTMGLDYNAVAKGMVEDSEATIKTVLDAAQTVPEHMRAGVLSAAFGTESVAVLAQLVNNQETVNKNLKAMGDSATYAGSMLAEFESVAGTSANQMQLFDNNMQAVKIALGTAFLPALNAVTQAFTPVLQAITAWAQENPALITGITAIVGGTLALGTALGAVGLAVPLITTALGGLAAIAGLVGTAITAISLPVVAVVAGVGALIAIGVALYRNWDQVKAKAAEVFNGLPKPVQEAVNNIRSYFEAMGKFIESALSVIVPAASAVWHSLSTLPIAAFETVKALVSVALSAIAALIKAGVTLFASVFNAGFNLIKAAFSTAFNIIRALVTGDMQGVKNAIKNGMSEAWGIVKKLGSDIVATFRTLGSDLLQAGRDAMQGFINGMSEKIGAAVDKAREAASRVKSAVTGFFDIRSPSRVMKQVGAWVSEGLAIGIEAKAPLAAKKAGEMAAKAKEAITSELDKLSRDIFIKRQELLGNPFAELTADIAWGQYQGQDTARLKQLAAINVELSNQLDMQKQIWQLEESIATHGMNKYEKWQWQWDNYSPQFIGVTPEQFDQMRALQSQLDDLTVNDSVTDRIKELNREIAVLGKTSALYEFAYDLEHTDKYLGATQENLLALKEAMQGLEAAKQAMADADFVRNKTAESAKAFGNLGNELFGGMSEADKLRLDYVNKMAVVDEFEALHTERVGEANRARAALEQQYSDSIEMLRFNTWHNQLAGVADFMKSMLGKSSSGYRALFYMERSFALASVLLENKKQLAKAWSSAPFPKNLPAVGQAMVTSGALVDGLKAIKPIVGQAHDGIASVPREGTWLLDKGERVVKPRDNDKLTRFLDQIDPEDWPRGGGGNTNIYVNVTSNGGDVQADTNMGKRMGEAIRAAVYDVLRTEKRQGGMLA